MSFCNSFEDAYIIFGKQEVKFTEVLDSMETLNEDYLLEINRRAVSRLNGIRKQRTEKKIAKVKTQYRVGDNIVFEQKGQRISGKIKSINRKTVSLIHCSDNKRWRVLPSNIVGFKQEKND